MSQRPQLTTFNSFNKNLTSAERQKFAAARRDIAARAREGALSFSAGVPVVPPSVALDQSKYTMQFVTKAVSQQKFNYLLNASRFAANEKINLWATIAVNMRKDPDNFFYLYEQNRLGIIDDKQCLSIAIGEKSSKFFEVLNTIAEEVQDAIQQSFTKKIEKLKVSKKTIQMGIPLFKARGDTYKEKFSLYLNKLIDGPISRRVARQLGVKISDNITIENWLLDDANKEKYHYKIAHASEDVMKATAITKAISINCPVIIQYLHFDPSVEEKFSFRLIEANQLDKSYAVPIRPNIQEQVSIIEEGNDDEGNSDTTTATTTQSNFPNVKRGKEIMKEKEDVETTEQIHYIVTKLTEKYAKELGVDPQQIDLNSQDIKDAFDMDKDMREIKLLEDYPKRADPREGKLAALKAKLAAKAKKNNDPLESFFETPLPNTADKEQADD